MSTFWKKISSSTNNLFRTFPQSIRTFINNGFLHRGLCFIPFLCAGYLSLCVHITEFSSSVCVHFVLNPLYAKSSSALCPAFSITFPAFLADSSHFTISLSPCYLNPSLAFCPAFSVTVLAFLFDSSHFTISLSPCYLNPSLAFCSGFSIAGRAACANLTRSTISLSPCYLNPSLAFCSGFSVTVHSLRR